MWQAFFDLLLAWLMGASEDRSERYYRVMTRVAVLLMAAAIATVLILFAEG